MKQNLEQKAIFEKIRKLRRLPKGAQLKITGVNENNQPYSVKGYKNKEIQKVGLIPYIFPLYDLETEKEIPILLKTITDLEIISLPPTYNSPKSSRNIKNNAQQASQPNSQSKTLEKEILYTIGGTDPD